jgi:hypothetical protein
MLKSKSTFDVRKALAFLSAGVRCGLTPARWTWQRPAGRIRFSASRNTCSISDETFFKAKERKSDTTRITHASTWGASKISSN